MKSDADKLARIMIRHTKSQRIGGEVALALPDCDVRTVLLDMSADEKTLYDDAACTDGVPYHLLLDRNDPDTLEYFGRAYGGSEITHGFFNRFEFTRCKLSATRPPERRPAARAAFDRMMVKVQIADTPAGQPRLVEYRPQLDKLTKFVALLRELGDLEQQDADSRAIVFTQYDEVQKDVVNVLEGSGWDVFEFNKQTAPSRRHKIIKEFQNGLKKDGRPKVCVATYHVAAVGVTLTAANRVFLMEPSEDPATELQAAGRIHRLGQTKEVLIKRFAFRNTIEHAIVDLHEEIKAKRVPARVGWDNKVVKDVMKRLKLDEIPHKPDPALTRDVTWKQPARGFAFGRHSYPAKWWKIRRSKCLCCKRVFDISAERLDAEPPNPTDDVPYYSLSHNDHEYWPNKPPAPPQSSGSSSSNSSVGMFSIFAPKQ
jgi:hypothetical protein